MNSFLTLRLVISLLLRHIIFMWRTLFDRLILRLLFLKRKAIPCDNGPESSEQSWESLTENAYDFHSQNRRSSHEKLPNGQKARLEPDSSHSESLVIESFNGENRSPKKDSAGNSSNSSAVD
jgi:hypothetical protein